MVYNISDKEIEYIKNKVLQEHFGVDNLDWVDECPNELSKEDIIAVIDIAIRKTIERLT